MLATGLNTAAIYIIEENAKKVRKNVDTNYLYSWLLQHINDDDDDKDDDLENND